MKSGGKYTEAHFQKPEVHFPEVNNPKRPDLAGEIANKNLALIRSRDFS